MLNIYDIMLYCDKVISATINHYQNEKKNPCPYALSDFQFIRMESKGKHLSQNPWI